MTTLELGGVHEMAAMLGVSKQRVYQLTQKPWFPRPLAKLACGSIYDMNDVREKLRAHGRVI